MFGCKTALLLSLASLVWGNVQAGPQSFHGGTGKAAQNAASLPFNIDDAHAIVLFFVASDCPVSNRLLPEMIRIEHEFAAHRVRFFFVYPNITETPAIIAAHRLAYNIDLENGNTLTDPHAVLAKFTRANVTPEAAVLVPAGTTLKSIYTGRIDDRFLSLGTERPAATHHDLEDAIAAVLTNRPVPPPGGPPIGCAFMNLGGK